MRIPRKFSDLTLKQFQELHKLSKVNVAPDDLIGKLDRVAQRLSILTGKSVEYIQNMPPKQLELIKDLTKDVDKIPADLKVPGKIRAGIYTLHPTTSLQEMKVNQMIDFLSLSKQYKDNRIENAHLLLATMFKPSVFPFSDAVYSPDKHSKVSDLLICASASDCLGLLFFWTDFLNKCGYKIQSCLITSHITIQETIDQILTDKEFLAFLNNGGGSTMSTYVEKIQELQKTKYTQTGT